MATNSVAPNLNSTIRTGNKAACAEFFGVSLPTIEGWVRRGMPVVQRGDKGIGWVIDLCAVAEWKFGNQTSSTADPESMTPIERKAWYEGETKRRDLQIRDRELIPAGDVERTIATAFAAISTGLRAIPDLLERKYGLSGEIAGNVSEALDLELEALADRLATLAPVTVDEAKTDAR